MQCHEFTTKHGRHHVTTRTAKISDCDQYRFWLCRDWTDAPSCGQNKRVAWLMLNPSTADRRVDDPTIVRCMKFSASWGYSGMLVVNLFPFRSSSPAHCKKWAAPAFDTKHLEFDVRRKRMQENGYWLRQVAQECDFHVVACGAQVFHPAWFEQCVDNFELDAEGRLFCLGLSSAGSPLHPMARGKLRVPDDRQPIPFPRG